MKTYTYSLSNFTALLLLAATVSPALADDPAPKVPAATEKPAVDKSATEKPADDKPLEVKLKTIDEATAKKA